MLGYHENPFPLSPPDFYFRNDPLVAKTAGVLLKGEARRMAVNFAKLPDLWERETATPDDCWTRRLCAGPRLRRQVPRNSLRHATASFAAFTGRALTILRAGFALKTVGSL